MKQILVGFILAVLSSMVFADDRISFEIEAKIINEKDGDVTNIVKSVALVIGEMHLVKISHEKDVYEIELTPIAIRNETVWLDYALSYPAVLVEHQKLVSKDEKQWVWVPVISRGVSGRVGAKMSSKTSVSEFPKSFVVTLTPTRSDQGTSK